MTYQNIFFRKLLKTTFLGVKSCEKLIARILKNFCPQNRQKNDVFYFKIVFVNFKKNFKKFLLRLKEHKIWRIFKKKFSSKSFFYVKIFGRDRQAVWQSRFNTRDSNNSGITFADLVISDYYFRMSNKCCPSIGIRQ